MNQLLETHKHIVGKSRPIFSMVAPSFSGVIVVIYGNVVYPIFYFTIMVFVKVLSRDSCDVLESITASLN